MSNTLKILVVDDVAMNRLVVGKHLQKAGHSIVEACDGKEAIEKFSSEQPDIIILDIMMPGMDGYQAAKEIKAQANGKWTPIIFLSALVKGEEQAKGLDAGGDDYLTKPVDLTILDAKIMSMQRIADMQRQLIKTSEELMFYHKQAEAEHEIANSVMERMINQERLNDEILQHSVLPASRFSGDIVAAARSDDGRLFILHADSTGHGLVAALPLIPLSQIFYAMVAKNFSLSEIIDEMNKQIKQLMPVERFVAAVLVMIDPVKKSMEVWNGCCPDVLFVDKNNKLIKSFPSMHTALGIVSGDTSYSETVIEDAQLAGKLLIYSDGLSEAKNSKGEFLGDSAILAAIEDSGDEGCMQAMIDAMSQHIDQGTAHDDISIVEVNCLWE